MIELNEQQLRDMFTSFYESKGHQKIESSSLVPHNDPTLLFTNAGMVQFKDVFLGLDKRPYKRATTVQKCVRAGGKHNDLDAVGRTARHHTFFEMLGNFSFGDYFKEDAIKFAWEFLTEKLELPKDRLYVTVFETDDEARQIWKKVTGFPDEKIIGLGEKDNFWAMGDVGPCGPCSEIFFDRGEQYTCDAEECALGKCDCDRWMEIWNLVFMQYERAEDGTLSPLPNPSIDTGMGLERMISILNHKDSNYEIPVMRSLMAWVEEKSGIPYSQGKEGFPFRVIADHIRSCSFLIADGVLPGNDGRSYVLKRILRRAVRFGKNLGFNEPFMYQMVPLLAKLMGEAYPQLVEQQDFISQVIRKEEESFYLTLNDGLKLVDDIIANLKEEGKNVISGEDAFKLYDTYGFPLDLTCDIAEEKGFDVDKDGFDKCMEEQRARARAARANGNAFGDKQALTALLEGVEKTNFIGYKEFTCEAEVKAIIVGDSLQEKANAGESGIIALDQTVFYGESGGQVGDTGSLKIGDTLVEITDTKKLPNGIFLHHFLVKTGEIKVNDKVNASIDVERRLAISRNHSATHLMQSALRQVLGSHVHQSGSYVNEERLRFDFAHIAPLTEEEIRKVEEIINKYILANYEVEISEKSIDEAKKDGALAFFGDKYGDIVRVVKMGDASTELCGGAHVNRTGDIGQIKVVAEAGIGAGIRRIEAVTGFNALAWWQEHLEKLTKASNLLKTNYLELPEKIEELQELSKEKDRELAKLNNILQAQAAGNIADSFEEVNGVKTLVAKVPANDMNELRDFADKLKEKEPSSVMVLAAINEGKVMLVATVSDDLIKRGFHAGNLIKEVAPVCGGGGGGRPNMAQAGGKNPEKVEDALNVAREAIKKVLA